jgi:4-aminobutyrate aminotransferase / (S)-3-amino-2-methylpropionate transaminase / 5-aminovalerate transaminase
MIAIELVERDTANPDAGFTAAVANAAREAGLIVLTCGTYGNVLRFLPPLSMSDELLNEGLDVLAEALSAS